MDFIKIALLFVATAIAEIVGCYLPWLVLKHDKTAWLLVPAALSLGLFAWLLTLHPSAAGRTYAAYGGVYIAVALAWLYLVDGVALRPHVPTRCVRICSRCSPCWNCGCRHCVAGNGGHRDAA